MKEPKWWQQAVFYQIYPRSFADGNGDGIGDLHGMIDRLDYLQDLGIDAIWLSPHYPSPIFDCGYDIADYVDVAPEYGTLDDFKRFLEGAHRRDMHVILDLVLNHTSHQHPWFIESGSSRRNPKRDWYVWHDGVDGGPPNNWYSGFGGPAWEYDPATDQYYYHFFMKEQPDLNWHNPEVKQAMWNAVRFWLDMGVDGFRLDAIDTIFEDPALPDHTSPMTQSELYRAEEEASSDEERRRLDEPRRLMMQHQVDQPGLHELMQELRGVIDEYPDRMLVGEAQEVAYYGDGTNELHLVFNFPLMKTKRLTPGWVRANQQERLAALPAGAWPCNTLGNHDSPRVYSRYGDGQNDGALARLSLALMLTLQGTPFLYNGEEIGMTNAVLDDIDQFRDVPLVRQIVRLTEEFGMPPALAVTIANRRGRDRCRTPMQWSNAANGGFCPAGVEPWLPVNPDYAQGVNVADQTDASDSLLSFYRRLLRVRKQTPALVVGDYVPLHEETDDYVAFLRTTDGLDLSRVGGEVEPEIKGQTCLVVLNTSDQTHTPDMNLEAAKARRVFSSHERQAETDDLSQLAIAPFEIYIGQLV